MKVIHWTKRGIVIWLAGALMLMLQGATLPAQTPTDAAALPDIGANLSEAEFQALLGRLSDEQVRDILIREFGQRRAEDSDGDGGIFANADTIVATISDNATALWQNWPALPGAFGAVFDRLAEAGGLGKTLLALILSCLVGFGVRRFWGRKAGLLQMELAKRNVTKGSYGTLGTIGDAIVVLLLGLSAVLAFAVAAMATLYALFHNEDLRSFVSGYILVVAVVLVVRSFVVWMFPRDWPMYRMVAISDEATRLVHWVILGLSGMWMFETTTSALMVQFAEPGSPAALPRGAPDLFSFLMGLVWIVLAQAGFYAIHRATSDLLPTRETPGFMALVTRNWFGLMSLSLFGFWILFTAGGLLSSDVDAIAGMVLRLQLIIMGFWAVYRIVVHYLRAQDFAPELAEAIRRTVRAALFAGGLIIAFAILGLDKASLQAGGLAERWIQGVISVGLTALIGWSAWDFIRTLIDIRIAAEQPEQNDEEGGDAEGGLGASRTATLLPLLRSTAFALIGVICLFSALSSLGVNVAPLVAGAGILGLAVGFGAQTLVKDVVSGVFFLIDDAFRRGEYIDLGTVKGTVERISVRSLQLRHHLGAVHTIPFGDIAALTNYSRDWVIMKLPLRLTFDTDPTQVKKIIKKLGAELMADEVLGDGLLAPPKSQGVIQMEDSAMILRVKFTAVPGKQFTIRRELLHRIRAAFEEAGIRFANREVTVRVSEDASPAERQQAITGAASRAVETDQPAT